MNKCSHINVNGNLITEAGRYQDSEGNRELAADVELEYTNRLEDKPESVITDETIIDPQTRTMANLRGYGYVANAFDVYNTDEDFKKLALDFSTDISKTATNFEEYLAQWSGFDNNIVKITKSNTFNLYHKVINNIYKNRNKQDIIADIFNRVA